MAIKGAKSIAEYAFRKWIHQSNLDPDYFTLDINGHEAILRDRNGDTLRLVYDPVYKSVFPYGM